MTALGRLQLINGYLLMAMDECKELQKPHYDPTARALAKLIQDKVRAWEGRIMETEAILKKLEAKMLAGAL
jgi:hypothetical protein